MAEMDDIWSRKREKLHRERKMQPLVKFTDNLRKDSGESVPNFDPDDGGVKAEVLFVFQDPGPTVKDSDFISRDNYPFNRRDYSARNVTETSDRVNLHRERTISWNAVPWRVEKKDLKREFRRAQRDECLTELLRLFEGRNLRAVALFGNYAHDLADEVMKAREDLGIRKDLGIFDEAPHSSIQAMNGQEGNRERFAETFRKIKEFLGE